jgi:membrane fusion protein (multidrug efflux system)
MAVLALIVILLILVIAYKTWLGIMIPKFMAANKPPPAEVSTITATTQPWQPEIKAVGSLRAVRGVDVTTEVAGLVRELHFKSGDNVRKDQLLVQLNAESDLAQLHALEASAEQANVVYERDKAQYQAEAIAKATLDADAADLKTKRALAEQQAAVVAKKSIRAPFTGRLGISTVNPGQYLNPGDKIVTLQAIDPILVDFSLPQQQLGYLSAGQKVAASADSFPGQVYNGNVQAIDPKVDPNTRNVLVSASIANPKRELLPGMFVTVNVESGGPRDYVTLPQTAVSFNPYGSTVYLVVDASKADIKPSEPKEEKGVGAKIVDKKAEEKMAKEPKSGLVAKQSFVVTGDTRGDQVTILSGVKAGDVVVTSGQLKLRNGASVAVNNKVLPSNEVAPKPVDQ